MKHYKTTAMLNQRRMIADPFELIMRNMRRSIEEEFDLDAGPEIFDGSIPEQVYTCRPS